MAWCKCVNLSFWIYLNEVSNILFQMFLFFFSLQANVMLEYDMDDAANLLSSNIETAKTHEKTIEEDLDFLRFVLFFYVFIFI